MKKILIGLIWLLLTGLSFAQNIAPSLGNLNCASLTNASALCSSADAANLTGTLASARVVGSYTGITGVGTLAVGAVPTTLLTGTLQATQHPALTGVITSNAGSLTTAFASSPSFTGTISAAALTLSSTITFPKTVIGSLPTCNGASQGASYVVTDALLPAALASVAAGGAVVVRVLCNGTAWIVG